MKKERLSLDAFKAEMNKNETQELEKLTGGILGDCHDGDEEFNVSDYVPFFFR